MVVAQACHLPYALPEYAGVGYAVACDEYILLVLAVGHRHIFVAYKELAQHDNSKNHSYNAKWVGKRTAQGGAAAVNAHLFQCLLCSGKRGGVGCGSA